MFSIVNQWSHAHRDHRLLLIMGQLCQMLVRIWENWSPHPDGT